jgi:hypothetical protein
MKHSRNRDEDDLQEYIKSLPPCSNHVSPSAMLRQDKKEALQANKQERVHSANTVETESNMTRLSTTKSNDSSKAKTMVGFVETGLSTETIKAECLDSILSALFQPSALNHSSASPASAKCIKPVIVVCTKTEEASFTEQRR